MPIPEDESLFSIPSEVKRKQHQLANLEGGSPADEAFKPPNVVAEPPLGTAGPVPLTIPDTWEDPWGAQKVRAEQQPDEGSEDRFVKAFLAGAGVDDITVRTGDAERMMREAGEIFRVVVAGMIAVLESRRALKREVGVTATEFQPAENNPLKFTLGVEDTVRILLAGGERGYLPPTQAFEEAFADIKEHQVAVLAGMQEAWMDLLRRLDPRALERRLDQDAGLGRLLTSRKARCWDAFIQLYETVAHDAEADYKSLFSRVFSHAYEKHLSTEAKKLR
jgi:type VI secretion system protein